MTVAITLQLSPQAAAALRELVEAGRAPSESALVESLVAREKALLDIERAEPFEGAMRHRGYRMDRGTDF